MPNRIHHFNIPGRLAQRESTAFTRQGPLVRSQYRPPTFILFRERARVRARYRLIVCWNKNLDCFAALAMTWLGISLSHHLRNNPRHFMHIFFRQRRMHQKKQTGFT